jgi:hypothetical protein
MDPKSDRVIIAKLDLEVDGYIKKQDEVQKTINSLTKKRDELLAGGRKEREELKNVQGVLDTVSKEYHNLAGKITASITANRSYIDNQYKMEAALKVTAKTHKEYNDLNDELANIRLGLNPLSASYIKDLAGINAKISENNGVLQEQNELQTEGYLSMDFYKKKVTESFDALNVFNGGMSGFISRAQSAGGVGKLFITSLSGMKNGIIGMGKAMAANPLGLLLTILGPIIEKLTTFTPVTQAVEKAFNALAPVMDLVNKPIQLLGVAVEWVAGGLSNLMNMMFSSANAASVLAKEQETLNKQMALQEGYNETAKQQANAQIKIYEDQTQSIAKRSEALVEAAKIESANMDERKALTDESVRLAEKELAQKKGIKDKEVEILWNGTKEERLAFIVKNKITDEELQNLEKAYLEKKRMAADEINLTEKQNARKKQLDQEDANNKKQATDNAIKSQKEKLQLFSAENAAHKQSVSQRIGFENEYAQRSISILKQELATKKISQEQYQTQVIQLQTQQRNNITQIRQQQAQDAIDLQKLELDKFIADQGVKARTLQEELDLAEKISKRKKDIIEAEYKASDKSAKAKLQHDIALQEVDNTTAQKRAALAVDNAAKELQAYKDAHQSKLADDVLLTEQSVENEKTRLAGIAAEEEKYQKNRLANGIIDRDQYNAEIKAIDQKFLEDQNALQVQFDDTEKARKAIDLENKRVTETANMDYDLGFQLSKLDAEKTQELEAAEKTGADKNLIEEKYAKMEKDSRKAVLDNKLDLANQAFGSMQAILGKESAAGKAMAVAQATIDTYKSAVSAYGSMSVIPIVGPALGAVAAAAAVAAGIQNVKKITSTKTPKAEKGALFSIGGKRHSQGGTLFTGQDGTRFEAEAGEVIGVMNRNAARHFMAFNNAFPAGGSSGGHNYFAAGGIVSREVALKELIWMNSQLK